MPQSIYHCHLFPLVHSLSLHCFSSSISQSISHFHLFFIHTYFPYTVVLPICHNQSIISTSHIYFPDTFSFLHATIILSFSPLFPCPLTFLTLFLFLFHSNFVPPSYYISTPPPTQETRDTINRHVVEFGEQLKRENEAALIIDGKTLIYALTPDLRKDFLDLCVSCKSVICCRVSPSQKAEVGWGVEVCLDVCVIRGVGGSVREGIVKSRKSFVF